MLNTKFCPFCHCTDVHRRKRKAIFTVSPFPASTLLSPNEFSFPNGTLEESFREFVPESSAVCNDIVSGGQPPSPVNYVITHAVRFYLLVMGLELMLCYMQGLRTVVIEY